MEAYTLEQAESDIATLRGQVQILTEHIATSVLTVSTSFTAPDGSVWTSTGIAGDTWHSISTVSNMTINAGGYIQYRKTIEGDMVEMVVVNVTASSTADGTTIVTSGNGVASGSRPLVEQRRPLAYAVAKSTVGAYPDAAFGIQTDGSIKCYGFAAADRIDGQFRYPLSI